MAERIVSAGVFTKEVDQSFLPAAIGQIGAAIVGPTQTGPALVPTKVTSYDQYKTVFGDASSNPVESYVPFAVKQYFENNGAAITVTRLLYEDGYALRNGALAVIASSGSGAGLVETVTHVLHPTQPVAFVSNTTNVFESSVINSDTNGNFEIKISGSFTELAVPGFTQWAAGNGVSISASIDSTSNKYVTNIFTNNAKSLDYPVYVQYENKNASSLFNNLANVSIKLAKITDYELKTDYSVATTPWVTSQKQGNIVKNLFRLKTISHGTGTNYQIKIGIRDIKLATQVAGSDYSEFTVDIFRVKTSDIPNPVYKYDQEPTSPVETYERCNLDPASPNYILKMIGDRTSTVTDDNAIVFSGNYANVSKYVIVEVASVVESGNAKGLIPFGFRALYSPILNPSGSVNLKEAQFIVSQSTSVLQYHGFNYSNLNNLNYLAPLPNDGTQLTAVTASNTDFYLGNVSQSYNPTGVLNFYSSSLEQALTSGSSFFATNILDTTRRFMVPFQGGFDGARPNLPKYAAENISATNTLGFDCDTASSTGTKAYLKAFSVLSNTDYYDFNILVTPGILNYLHEDVTSAARSLVTTRQDAFYVMDTNPITSAIQSVINNVTTIDNNYTATYWPWIKIDGGDKDIWVPPSVVVLGALAKNDSMPGSAPWYAPAGLNRGGITSALQAYTPLDQPQRDSLYLARINPIATFPGDSIVIWGQKTLQATPSALDRVNVRRLLIAVKKFIASSTRYLVFEQNVQETRDKFLSIVNPYLQSVKANQGLYAFRVIMDQSNNTPDLIDRNILYGQIFLQPTRTAEFILLDFNIQPTGAGFG